MEKLKIYKIYLLESFANRKAAGNITAILQGNAIKE